MSFSWKDIVSTVAPTVATALGTPVAGLAVSAISSAIFGHEKATEEEISKHLQALTPEKAAALKQADMQLQAKLKELDIDLERIQAADRDSARQREAKTNDWTPKLLAFVILAGFFATICYVFFGVIKPEVAGIAGTLIGYVSAKADSVVTYYFGSSSGSAEKNRMLEHAFGKAAQKQAMAVKFGVK